MSNEPALEFLHRLVGDDYEALRLTGAQVIALNRLIRARKSQAPPDPKNEDEIKTSTFTDEADVEVISDTFGLAPGTVLQDRYDVVRLLGKGGMSAVYEAVDRRLGATVALKETFSKDQSLRRQFEREARLLAQLNHPSLPRVSDYFTEGQRAFLVMQFISGVDLATIMAQQPGRFPRNVVMSWADELLDALIYLHSSDRQVIHRDIKPHNLRLTSTGRIVLLDFGLATAESADPSQTRVFGYTRQYAPLEQIQDQGASPQSDVYALGATIYHLLTGSKPPNALIRSVALRDLKPDPLKPADEIQPSVGPEVAAILYRAMAQDPQDRYASASEFRDALRRVAANFADTSSATDDVPSPLTTDELRFQPSQMASETEVVRMVGRDPKFLQIQETIRIAAPSDAAVLIEGESGTGKELIARSLHAQSGRALGPFITLSIAAIPSELIEPDLLGHEKGAIIGTLHNKLGRLELARGGTLFIDEIEEMPMPLQSRLLRVLKEGKFRRLGDNRDRPADFRLICATNEDTPRLLAGGRLRRDFYDRVSTIRIQVPPLRERRDDVLPLAQHFLEHFNRKYERNVREIPAEVLSLLSDYDWPGNVRELRNTIERAVVLCQTDKLTLQDLPEALTAVRFPSRSPSRPLDEAEDSRVEQANTIEQEARELLALHNYGQARSCLAKAAVLDPGRAERLTEELGFILNDSNSSSEDLQGSENEKASLRWQANVWKILSDRNHFELPLREGQPAQAVGENIPEPKEAGPIAVVQSESTPEQRGELLEQAVLRLFREFFSVGENDEEQLQRLKTLRQQQRGLQFGFDIAVEFDCVLEWNRTIRCHVECKNLSGRIALKDIADKLISKSQFDPEIDLWILISPNADPSNELEHILQSWKRHSPYAFDVRVWSPATGVADFFGLEPSVYDLFFENEIAQQHPKNWDTTKRDAVRERWKDELSPPLRLPKGWTKYLQTAFLMCLRREEARVLDATFANHVTMQCKNEARALMPLPLEHYIRQWLIQPDKPVLFLLGDFGDGKTFFTYTLARQLADEFLQNPKTSWIPLRLCLRDFYEAGSSRDFLRLRLDEFGADLEGWTTLLANQRLLVILDGFDEISKQLDPAAITKNITALIKCYEEFDGCKVLITSRTHFFERRQDVKRLMTRLGDPVLYYLAPISRQTTIQHLEDTARHLDLPQSLAKLHSLHDPIGLAAKPLFLQMLKDTLHNLPDDLDEVTLYEKYILNSLRRKAEQLDDAELAIDRKELLENLTLLLEEIAVELQVSTNEYVSLSHFAEMRQKNFAEVLWRMTGSDDYQEDAKARIGVRSLLSRVETPDMENEWTVDFCHRSIREYFVARRLCSAVRGSIQEGAHILKEVPVNHEILDFAAMHMRKSDIQRWQKSLLRIIQEATPKRKPGRLGGNAITLLYRISADLPDTEWTGKVFDFADLEGADFSGKNFQRSSFRFANLTNANLEDADFENCDFTGVRIEETAAVSSVAAFPSGDSLLAIYGDGTARKWNLQHPRKTESRLVGERLNPQATIGMLRNGQSWIRDPTTFAFIDAHQNADMHPGASFPIKDSYRFAMPGVSEMAVVETTPDGESRVLMIDLERQEIIEILESSSTTVCAALAQDALVFDDIGPVLRIIELDVEKNQPSTDLLNGLITCLSSIQIANKVHIIVCGQNDGSLHAWFIDLRKESYSLRKILDGRIHDGLVTTVTFLDEGRIVSGGNDRAIVVTRINIDGRTLTGILERKLKLTLRCRGMRIKGLKGPDEHRKLHELIAKAETKVKVQ
jgi:DNA-binding NtrC family response regulator